MNLTIDKDLTKNKLIDQFGTKTLTERYFGADEHNPQDVFARAAVFGSKGDMDFARRIYGYISNLWFMPSTPILSNGGLERGLPISCFLTYTPDSLTGLTDHWAEVTYLSSAGGGLAGFWGDVRSDGTATSKGSKSTGSVPFQHVVDSIMLAASQGITRRAGYAVYQDISHPEIEEVINMRRPTGGDPNRKNLNLHHGVNIPDSFMRIIDGCANGTCTDDSWDLIDPHTKKVTKTVSAKKLWQDLLTTRFETGEPYIHFIDTTNNLQPDCHKKLGLKVRQSNLCSEIVLPTNEERTAVCCLSSVNLEYYDDWKDTDLVKDVTRFLDNILSEFIKLAPDTIAKAKFSASRERSIGIGAMGFHAYLQKKNIAFESAVAIGRTKEIFKHIREEAEEASYELALEYGNAPDIDEAFNSSAAGWSMYKGAAKRNVHLLAVAPNASSSIICGNTSPSIEPYRANTFTQKTSVGSNNFKNKHLDKLLMTKIGHVDLYEETWQSIKDFGGSVQHLEILDENEKLVFKTAEEIDQNWITEHAGFRQEFIDQSQSVNLFFKADTSKKYLHDVHLGAWKKGLKTLYYLRSIAVSRPENINAKFDRHSYEASSSSTDDDGGCLSCEG